MPIVPLAVPTPSAYVFTRNLGYKDNGTEVLKLQQHLRSLGLLSSTPTGYFGTATRDALIAYQKANRIVPAIGYFGPKTRLHVNGR